MHLVSEGFDVTETCVLCLENGLVCNIEVKKTLFCQIVSAQPLRFLLENLGQRSDELLRLMPVAAKEISESDDALLFIP